MANLYNEVEFPIRINMPPSSLHSGLYEEIEQSVKRRLVGRCHPGIGFIKKAQVVKKQLGKFEGAHLTGNVTFSLQVRCSAAMPVVGQRLSCMVVTKNEFGVLATNYQLPAYTMLIMKMPDDTSDAIDRIQRGSYIEVEVLAYQLKADNMAERTRAEYWLICSLVNAKVDEVRYQVLPKVTEKPQLLINSQTSLSTIDDKRKELTGGVYTELEATKNSIQHIRDDYIQMLSENAENIKRDIMLSTLLRNNNRNFIVGILRKVANSTHMVDVLWSGLSTLSEQNKNLPIKVKKNVETINIGVAILYQNIDLENYTADSYNVLDFWGRHVKYVINETEMVHPNNQYINQLSQIIYGISDKIKRTVNGNRIIFAKDGKPVATLLRVNKHVINRAYYKMREFIDFFGEEIFPRKSMKIACIAESPGGFVQALLDQRGGYDPSTGVKVETGIRDNINTISIGINGPPWAQLTEKLNKDYGFVYLRSANDDDIDKLADPNKTNVQVVDGNILTESARARFNIEFDDAFGGKADLITGDGGIERNKKETTEEMDTHRLLLSEIIIALNCQKQGGSFILKIYDMATEFTMNMIQVLSYCYEEIGLFKPSTSRAASSEKYLVCKRFQASETDLTNILAQLGKILALEGDAYSYYGNMINVEDPKLKQAIVNYNTYYMKQQIAFIESGRAYATMYNNTIRSNNVEKMTMDIRAKISTQVSTADEFINSIQN